VSNKTLIAPSVLSSDFSKLGDEVEAIVAAAGAVPAPSVRQGPILVGLQFDAWGGGAQPEGAVAPIPRDWYAHFSKDGGVLDDAFMARVWPD
jgi:hypothetical protein